MKNLIGKRFGKLIVVGQSNNDKYEKTTWICKCDCGNIKIVSRNHLMMGNVKSCGCLRIKHGHAKRGKHSKTYYVWGAMIQRCTNKNCKEYKYYGRRGIKVCKRWSNKETGYINFLSDMGECPKGLTLDRINNDGNYYKVNCRWTTMKEQANNRRSNKLDS